MAAALRAALEAPRLVAARPVTLREPVAGAREPVAAQPVGLQEPALAVRRG